MNFQNTFLNPKYPNDNNKRIVFYIAPNVSHLWLINVIIKKTIRYNVCMKQDMCNRLLLSFVTCWHTFLHDRISFSLVNSVLQFNNAKNNNAGIPLDIFNTLTNLLIALHEFNKEPGYLKIMSTILDKWDVINR